MTHDVQPLKWSKKTNFEEHMQFFDKINEIVNNLGPTVDAAESAIASIEDVKTNAESAVATANQASSEARAAAAQAQGAAQSVADVDSRIAGKADASNVYTKTETDNKLSGKLDKTGGTLTGALVQNVTGVVRLPVNAGVGGNTFRDIQFQDNANVRRGMVRTQVNSDNTITQVASYSFDGTKLSALTLTILENGTSYATCPTPSASNDNSTKIATTAWVNSASSVVHKTGNETIAGTKTFSTMPVVPATPSNATGNEIATAGWVNSASSVVHKTGNETIAGTKTFSTMPVVPATPSNATGNEIATAGWVNTKLSAKQTKITYGTADPTGGSVGDVYIKI